MRKTTFLILMTTLVLVGALGCDKLGSRFRSDRPKNIVLIVIDALRADHLGCYGYAKNTSPNIDALAAKSAVFEQAYSHAPWTMPSIASILTGLHPRDHGVTGWKDPLIASRLTLAEHLKTVGYHTAGCVSHTILVPKYGYDQGFDLYDTSVLEKGYPLDTFSSEHVTDFAVSALNKSLSEPFFLFLHYFDPHKKYFQHEGFFFGHNKVGKYDSEIAFTDHHIGRLLDLIKEKGLDDDTIVVITADHGEEFYDHGGKLHGWKIYEEVVRIPLIIHVPGFTPQRIQPIVAQSDLAPTLLSLAGLAVPEQMKGKAFETSTNNFRPRYNRSVFFETYFMDEVCKHGVRTGNWKLIHNCDVKTWELFDLKVDPKEGTNLVESKPQKFTELKDKLNSFYRTAPSSVPKKTEMTDELKDYLKSLGYIQ